MYQEFPIASAPEADPFAPVPEDETPTAQLEKPAEPVEESPMASTLEGLPFAYPLQCTESAFPNP